MHKFNPIDREMKRQQENAFDPNGVSASQNIYGLPYSPTTAQVLVIPVPWEVTVSYTQGTAKGPEAILNASAQVDLFQEDVVDAWKLGIAMLPKDTELEAESETLREQAYSYIQWLEDGSPDDTALAMAGIPVKVDQGSHRMNEWVYQMAKGVVESGRIPVLLGGDHSTPFGMVMALAEKYPSFGILQIDAHADLRPAYEGFTYSHASIAYNWLESGCVDKLVQVGLRDYCEQEYQLSQTDDRIVWFTNQQLMERRFEGETWKNQCERIVSELPQLVYLSVDIDGLDPKYCPNTGTPVAGGLQVEELMYLVKMVVRSGRKIIGFDLVEVAPGSDGDEWDANVGARVLYRICNYLGCSQGLLTLS